MFVGSTKIQKLWKIPKLNGKKIPQKYVDQYPQTNDTHIHINYYMTSRLCHHVQISERVSSCKLFTVCINTDTCNRAGLCECIGTCNKVMIS